MVATDDVKHVFLSYVHEDSDRVDGLCRVLDAARIRYWRDRKDLAPGDAWKLKIREAIQSGSLAFLACFSANSISRAKSYMNEELTIAIEEFRLRTPEQTWLIPVRFDQSDLPEFDLGAGRRLSDLNYADLYEPAYAAQATSLVLAINRLFDAKDQSRESALASVEVAVESDRPSVLRRLTKQMVPEYSRRIELDEIVSGETTHLLRRMRDEADFPTQSLNSNGNEQVIALAQLAHRYVQLVEPFCWSLQVAARWAEGEGLAPWVSALRSLTNEAVRIRGGFTALLDLRYIPTLVSTSTAALAAVGQGRWDNLKLLIADARVIDGHINRSVPLLDAVNPWTPFTHFSDVVTNVIARTAATGQPPEDVLTGLTNQTIAKYRMPSAEWLASVLRPAFTEQFVDDETYYREFDRTEVMLGLIGQDLANVEASSASEEAPRWKRSSRWFGRATWRANETGRSALEDIVDEKKAAGITWGPLQANLFGGDTSRLDAAISEYAEDFERARGHHW